MIKAYDLLEEGKGILRLAPTWVPRSFCRPAKRIKLHPDDYYVLGLERGGIDERWLSSATPADNGPGTPEDEGLSYAVSRDGKAGFCCVTQWMYSKVRWLEKHSGKNTKDGLCSLSFSTTRGRFPIIFITVKSTPAG